jgi:hypothetical protein
MPSRRDAREASDRLSYPAPDESRAIDRRAVAPNLVASGQPALRGLARFARPAIVNGAAGIVTAPGGRPYAVLGFTIRGTKIIEIDVVADPERLRGLDVSAFD